MRMFLVAIAVFCLAVQAQAGRFVERVCDSAELSMPSSSTGAIQSAARTEEIVTAHLVAREVVRLPVNGAPIKNASHSRTLLIETPVVERVKIIRQPIIVERIRTIAVPVRERVFFEAAPVCRAQRQIAFLDSCGRAAVIQRQKIVQRSRGFRSRSVFKSRSIARGRI